MPFRFVGSMYPVDGVPAPVIMLRGAGQQQLEAGDVLVLGGASDRSVEPYPGNAEVRYPAPGAPGLAQRVRELLHPLELRTDLEWGLDHGTWSVLRHVFPAADVPVVQFSIDESRPPSFHYEMGRRLRPLRDEGVLLMGSGDIVHNLHAYAWGRHPVDPFDWAKRFERKARELMLRGDHAPLVNYELLGKDAELSIPTPEHFLPLLYVLGASDEGETITFPVEGMDGGSISMLCVQFG